MSTNPKIAIIGHGFVGKAVDYGFPDCEKIIIDPIYGTKIEELVGSGIHAAFICVPTPMGDDGSIDSSIVENCVTFLKNNVDCIIILKSTVTPAVISKIVQTEQDEKLFVYNPEFLTERNANFDFVNADFHVFGGNPDTVDLIHELYLDHSICDFYNRYPTILKMSAIEASFVKYGINDFLATKVLWFNQFYDLVKTYGGSYDKIRQGISADPRIGPSHTKVPGHDGRRGYGGACFAKDTIALVKFARDNKQPLTVLEEVIRKNQEYRSAYNTVDDREAAQHVRFDHKI